MEIEAASKSTAAAALGFSTGPDLSPDRRRFADEIRRLVSVRGFLPYSELQSWAVSIARLAGHGESDALPLIRKVIDALILIGDLGAATISGEVWIISRPSRRVAFGDAMTVLLGTGEDDAELAWSGPERYRPLCRHVRARSGDADLLTELGDPSFHNSLSALDLPVSSGAGIGELINLLATHTGRNGRKIPADRCEILQHDRADSRLSCGYTDGKASIFIPTSGDECLSLDLPDQESLRWLAFGFQRTPVSCSFRHDGQVDLPAQLRRALMLSGSEHDEGNTWTLREGTEFTINSWIGSDTGSWTIRPSPGIADLDQKAVIGAPATDRLLVEAGPGSGKTWVAINRVVHLIEEGVSPTRIWLLSFTRAAVEELRKRVGEHLGSYSK